MRDRLTARGQDNSDTIEQRMREAKAEMSHYVEYDYLVVNDQFDQALSDLTNIINSRRLSQACQASKLVELLKDLLK